MFEFVLAAAKPLLLALSVMKPNVDELKTVCEGERERERKLGE